MKLTSLQKTIGIITTTITLTSVVLTYFFLQQEDRKAHEHRIELNEVISKFNSIERNLGDDKYFDIQNLLISEEKARLLDEQLQFNIGSSFYAAKSDSYWHFELVKDYKKFCEAFYLDPQKLVQDRTSIEHFLEESPVSYWYSSDSLNFITSDSIPRRIYTKTTLQSIPFVTMRQIESLAFLNETMWTMKDGKVDTASLFSLHRQFTQQNENDRVGKMLSDHIIERIEFSLKNRNIIMKIEELEKFDDVSYARVRTDFFNCLIDNKPVMKITQVEEVFFVSRERDIVVITMTYPTTEPRVKKSIELNINAWLNQLKLIN
jgi:hypothetical protein